MDRTNKFIDPSLLSMRIIEHQPAHDVIYSATPGLDGKIYLGLSGETGKGGCYAKLLAYDPKQDVFEEAADFAKLIRHDPDELRHPHSKIHTAICVGNDGKIYASTHVTAPPMGEDYYHYWEVYNDPARGFLGSHLIIYDPATGGAEDFGLVVPRGGSRWMSYNPELEELYMTGYQTCHFIVVRLKTGEVKDLGRISQHDWMGPCYSADGYVYTTTNDGFIVRYDPKRQTFTQLETQLPHASWCNTDSSGVFQFVPGPDKIKLYGVALASHRVFGFDPTAGKHGTIRDYGTLLAEDRRNEFVEALAFPRTITVGADGLIYIGTKHYIGPNPGSHIVTIDIASGEKKDYGLVRLPGFAQFNTPTAAAVGLNGDVYFVGERPNDNEPLSIMIFNPCGVNKPLPDYYYKQYQETAVPLPPDPEHLRYYFHTRQDNRVFVSEGTFLAQELGYSGRVPVIPRLESAITGLAINRMGVLFGITSGLQGHLFCYLPLSKKLVPLALYGSGPETGRGMLVDGKGDFYWGSETTGHLYRYRTESYDFELLERDVCDRGEFCAYRNRPSEKLRKVDDLGAIVYGEGITALVSDGESRLFGLTAAGKFFTYDLISGKAAVKDIFAEFIKLKSNIPQALVWYKGKVIFSVHHGYLAVYTPETDALRVTGAKAPVAGGRDYLNKVTAWVEASDGTLFGGTFADGNIFIMDWQRERTVNLGKAGNENSIKGITLGSDGMIWLLAGGPGELVHLQRFVPWNHEFTDLGLIRAKIPKTWILHQAETIITGLDGELYIGENDAISHLFTYFPPISQGKTAILAGNVMPN